jgi:hypothetical protein
LEASLHSVNLTNQTGPVEAKQIPSKNSKRKPKRKMDATKGSAKTAWKSRGKIGVSPEDMVRKYKFSYPLVIYEGRNLTEADVLFDLNIYFKKILNNEAGNDTYSYPRLIGTDWENPSIRAMFFYRERKL